jgi:hypothetical protein
MFFVSGLKTPVPRQLEIFRLNVHTGSGPAAPRKDDDSCNSPPIPDLVQQTDGRALIAGVDERVADRPEHPEAHAEKRQGK